MIYLIQNPYACHEQDIIETVEGPEGLNFGPAWREFILKEIGEKPDREISGIIADNPEYTKWREGYKKLEKDKSKFFEYIGVKVVEADFANLLSVYEF